MGKRIEWVDIAKGITIILMVLGHTGIGGLPAKWIWSFHMPLFFIVSGMFYDPKRTSSLWILLKKRGKTLIVPFIFFSVICYILSYTGLPLLERPNLLYGWGGTALWFIPVLLFAEIVFFVLITAARLNHYVLAFLLLGVYLIGYILYKKEIALPWKLDVSCIATSFYGMGFLLKDRIITLQPKWWLLCCSFAISVVGAYFLPRLDMCCNCYGSLLLNEILAAIGTSAIFFLSLYVDKITGRLKLIRQILKYFGQNTIVILGLSQVTLVLINAAFMPFAVDKVLTFPLRQLLLWLILWGICVVLNKYGRPLIGKK